MKRSRTWLVALVVLMAGVASPSRAADAEPREDVERAVVREINKIRQGRGLPSLATDARLSAVAREYSCRMARESFVAHESPSGQRLADRVRAAGKDYRRAGENLAWNRNVSDPVTNAVRGWMKSAGHRENILGRAYTETGVGVCQSGAAFYFTEIFVQPR